MINRDKMIGFIILGLFVSTIVGAIVGFASILDVGVFYVIQRMATSWVAVDATFSYVTLATWSIGYYFLTVFMSLFIYPIVFLLFRKHITPDRRWIVKQTIQFFYVYLFFYLLDYYQDGLQITLYGSLLLTIAFCLLNDLLDSDFLEKQVKHLFKKNKQDDNKTEKENK